MPRISKDAPLAELTLRRYEKPFQMERRELVRKLCLSIGLLQPGDSRDVMVDVFHAILDAKEPISAEEITTRVITLRESHKLPPLGIAPSNIRRQLKRLKDLFFIEKVGTRYRLTENLKLIEIFEQRIEKYYLATIVERVKEYLKAAQE